MAGAPVMSPIANGRTLVVGEMPSLAGIIVATLLVDVMWPLPSLVDGSAALPDVVGRWTPGIGVWFPLAVGASEALDVRGKWPTFDGTYVV